MSATAVRFLALVGGALASVASAQNTGPGAAHSYPPRFGSDQTRRSTVNLAPLFSRGKAKSRVREIVEKSRAGYMGSELRYAAPSIDRDFHAAFFTSLRLGGEFVPHRHQYSLRFDGDDLDGFGLAPYSLGFSGRLDLHGRIHDSRYRYP